MSAERSRYSPEFKDEAVRFVIDSGRPIGDVPPLVLEPRGCTALLDAIGRLGVISAFEPIPQLLTPEAARQFQADIQGALAGLQTKRKAKLILDTVIDVVLIGAKIATKLAVI